MEKRVDTFQRNLRREILNVKWSRIRTNEELYERNNVVHRIKHRRLIWYGHAQRLSNETPAKSVINYIEQNSDVTKLRDAKQQHDLNYWKQI